METPPETAYDDVPTVENNRHKIIWFEENLESYTDLIQPVLLDLQETWLESSSPSLMSILLQQTNNILSAAAKATQKVIYLNNDHKKRKPPIPPELSEASSNHSHSHDILKKVLSDPTCSEVDTLSAKTTFSITKADLQKTKRRLSVIQKLTEFKSSTPSALPILAPSSDPSRMKNVRVSASIS